MNNRMVLLFPKFDEVLVGELRSVDRFASGAVSGGEIAALAHESGDYAVEL